MANSNESAKRELPNLVYADGTRWRLYRDGELTGRAQLEIALLRHLCPDPGTRTDNVAAVPESAVTAERQHASGQR